MIGAYERAAQKLIQNMPKPRKIVRVYGNRMISGTASLHRTKQAVRWRLFWRMKQRLMK